MSMNQPLTGCVMKGPKSITPDFAPIAASFLYQSEALGMNIAANENCADNEALCFEFETPHTAPVICEITRWEDPSRQATVSENIMQAACGLMSVHGRTHRQPKPLGLNYVSTLTAALALQGSIAATIGRLRGLPVSGSTVSMAAAALLSMSQYIAGATASESPETAETTCSLPGSSPACPPFVSLDGVFFELETLDAGPWQKFWTELGVSSAAAGKGWRAFLLRYARAASPLPDELPLAISKLTYHRISQICAKTGMAICPVRSIDDRAQDDDARQIWQQGPWSF
jgi:crotonobetainyl-CoA:carnitine CoA-transferase CaiB-like acyl-CoA transferase